MRGNKTSEIKSYSKFYFNDGFYKSRTVYIYRMQKHYREYILKLKLRNGQDKYKYFFNL